MPRRGPSPHVARYPIVRVPAPTRRRRAPTTDRRSAGSPRSRSVETPSNRPPTSPITIGFARRLAAQIPTAANRKYPKRSGRRCPPTVSRPNGAITSNAAAAYATTVRCRHSRTTRAIAPASMMAATTFCTKSTRRSDGCLTHDDAQDLAREPSAHEARPVVDVPQRSSVLAEVVSGLGEPLRNLEDDADGQRPADDLLDLAPCGRLSRSGLAGPASATPTPTPAPIQGS